MAGDIPPIPDWRRGPRRRSPIEGAWAGTEQGLDPASRVEPGFRPVAAACPMSAGAASILSEEPFARRIERTIRVPIADLAL